MSNVQKERGGPSLYRTLMEMLQDKIKLSTTAMHLSAVQFANDQKPESRAEFLRHREYIKGLEHAQEVVRSASGTFAILDVKEGT